MTTDVTNTQMAFQMSLRIAVRAPLMAPGSMAMCFVISPRLSLVFLAALVVLGVALFGVMGLTTAHLPAGVPPVRRLKRQRPGERLRHPHGEGLRPGEVRK